jgi:hypothetical protein
MIQLTQLNGLPSCRQLGLERIFKRQPKDAAIPAFKPMPGITAKKGA